MKMTSNVTDDEDRAPTRHRQLTKLRWLTAASTPGTGGRTAHIPAMRRIGTLVDLPATAVDPDSAA
jgi:hypothetical protein